MALAAQLAVAQAFPFVLHKSEPFFAGRLFYVGRNPIYFHHDNKGNCILRDFRGLVVCISFTHENQSFQNVRIVLPFEECTGSSCLDRLIQAEDKPFLQYPESLRSPDDLRPRQTAGNKTYCLFLREIPSIG